jgi:hypothetical protein
MLEYNQDRHGRIVALHSPITYLIGVVEEATKTAEVARKLKVCKKSILSINVYRKRPLLLREDEDLQQISRCVCVYRALLNRVGLLLNKGAELLKDIVKLSRTIT